MFIVGHRHCQFPSSLAQFLSPWVAKLHLVDGTIDEIKICVEDPDELFDAMLEAARCGSILVDSGHWLMLMVICAALGNSEFSESIWSQLGYDLLRENVVDRL
jgi:hypothetical protein